MFVVPVHTESFVSIEMTEKARLYFSDRSSPEHFGKHQVTQVIHTPSFFEFRCRTVTYIEVADISSEGIDRNKLQHFWKSIQPSDFTKNTLIIIDDLSKRYLLVVSLLLAAQKDFSEKALEAAVQKAKPFFPEEAGKKTNEVFLSGLKELGSPKKEPIKEEPPKERGKGSFFRKVLSCCGSTEADYTKLG